MGIRSFQESVTGSERMRLAAGAGGDGIAVGAGFRVAEEGADALVEFGRDDVLEAARLLLGFAVFDGESIGEQAFGQAVAANYIAGAAGSRFGEAHFAIAAGGTAVAVAAAAIRLELNQARIGHAREQARRGFLAKNGQLTRG